MNIVTIIKLIGIVCWLLHQAHHTTTATFTYPAEDGEAEGLTVAKRMCRKCGKTWEVPA